MQKTPPKPDWRDYGAMKSTPEPLEDSRSVQVRGSASPSELELTEQSFPFVDEQRQCIPKFMLGEGSFLSQGTPSEITNEIHTSKYRWYTFVPLNLYEQFHNLANVYFLFIAFLQTIPSISITSGKPLMLMPLGFVLAVGAARDLFEDQKRKSADRSENEREVSQIYDPSGSERTIHWHTVRPGYLLRIRRGELIPADCLLIGSSATNNGCTVETSNLDGETDHKPKAAAIAGGALGSPTKVQSWEAAEPYRVDFQQPNADLYNFRGALAKSGEAPIGLNINNVLLRGCTMHDADWADCLVLYCGHDTRVMRNQRGARFKASQLDVEMNRVIMLIFALQLILCTIGGTFYAMWETTHFDNAWYLMPEKKDRLEHVGAAVSTIEKACTWLLQLNNMVPISLIVMVTTVKFLQGKFLAADSAIYDVERKKGAEVHTSQVLESLGQVTHVFSDKTGTLTCNQMVYKCCAVAGQIFESSEADATRSKRALPEWVKNPQDHSMCQFYVDFDFGRRALLKAMKTAEDVRNKKEQELLGNFWLCHAVCHTISVQGGDAAKKNGTLAYSASSPDELALVWAAHDIGLSFRGQIENTINLQVMDRSLAGTLAAVCASWGSKSCPVDLQIEMLSLCEFDNDRKRMSVVVGFPDGRKVMYLKGADSAVLPHIPVKQREEAGTQLQQFACSGLRTLVLAYRELSSDEYSTWSRAYKDAQAQISDDRDIKVKELIEKLESAAGLALLGVTAIEDRLQDGVPDTLQFIRQAGITVWVLTGDKLETAICIGKSCRLLTETMDNVQITGDVEEILDKFESNKLQPEERAITITGAALAAILEDDTLKLRFYKMAKDCKTVICCRVSPKQKADVVEMVKALHEDLSNEQPITLAIGDGANDVSMITSAHVGVGLSGKEGAQAARAADFAMGQFRFLRRLIFVHGRESYRRNSTVVNYNFYKNMVLVMPAAFFGPSMAFSGQPFYEQILYQLYNVVFTFWPGVFYAIFDRPVEDLTMLEDNEELYAPALRKQFFGRKVFACWLVAGMLQGLLIEFAAFYVFGNLGNTPDDSNPNSLWLSGTAAYFWVVLGVNLTLYHRLALTITINVFVIVFSVCCFPVFVFLLDDVAENKFLHGISPLLFGLPGWRYWFITGLVVFLFLGLGEPLIRSVSFGLLPAERTSYLRHDTYSPMKNTIFC